MSVQERAHFWMISRLGLFANRESMNLPELNMSLVVLDCLATALVCGSLTKPACELFIIENFFNPEKQQLDDVYCQTQLVAGRKWNLISLVNSTPQWTLSLDSIVGG